MAPTNFQVSGEVRKLTFGPLKPDPLAGQPETSCPTRKDKQYRVSAQKGEPIQVKSQS